MKRIFTYITCLLFLCQLSACATGMLWSKNATTYTDIYEDIGQDKVYAFAQIKQDKAMFQAGDLVMMGEAYWYVVDKKIAEDEYLLPILNTDLPLPYQVDKINIVLTEKNTQTQTTPFSTHFCLHYDAKNNQKINQLKKINFKADDKLPEHYQHCLSLNGKLYRAPEKMMADYHFEQTIPVYLQTYTREKHTNLPLYVGQLLGSAVTVPVDVVLVGATIVGLIPIFMWVDITQGGIHK